MLKDVIIIGSGVVGSAVARELSRLELDVLVLEKGNDVATGTSKANSGIVHAGFDCKPGTMKARMNFEGAALMPALAKDLDFRYRNNGAFVLCFDKDKLKDLEDLLSKGKANGIAGLSIMSGDEIRRLEPNISSAVIAGLHSSTSAIVSPYDMNIALAENAKANGAEFMFNTKVTKINRLSDFYEVITNRGSYSAKTIANAAGIHGDEINNMVCSKRYSFISRKGEYCLMDRTAGNMCSSTLFQLPTPMGKGILVTPTAEGNLLLGPTATDIDDKLNVDTTAKGLSEVFDKAVLTMPALSKRDIITQFSGLRAHLPEDDFVIEESEDGFFNALGIESPGLSSAPAIGVYIAGLISKKLNAQYKQLFIKTRRGIRHFADLTGQQRMELIKSDKRYGRVICRCETVTEGEIVESLHSLIPARDLDGVKRRTRSQTGRCQSGFCAPLILEIISRELNIPVTEVTKNGGSSSILTGKNKEI